MTRRDPLLFRSKFAAEIIGKEGMDSDGRIGKVRHAGQERGRPIEFVVWFETGIGQPYPNGLFREVVLEKTVRGWRNNFLNQKRGK
jgi:hypothetical protein